MGFTISTCLLLSWTVLLVTVRQISSQDASEGTCVMHGQCGEGDYGSLNCVYNGKAKPVDDPEAISMLKQICPEYVDGDKAVTCCDAQQIESMDANFKLPQRLLGKCPSCFYNFRKTFCKLTCAPNQSQYLKVTGTIKSDEGKDMVTEIAYYVAETFANGLFNSCKSVEGIIPGTRVIDLMCGRHGSKCDGVKWLRFMGSTPENQGFSPFQINYNFTSEPKVEELGQVFYPMAENTHKCNVAPAASEKACGCSDCPDSCAAVEAPTTTAATSTSESTTDGDKSVIVEGSSSTTSTTSSPDSAAAILTARGGGHSESGSDSTSGASESKPKLLNNRLFRRILSPLIVIAPAFADD